MAKKTKKSVSKTKKVHRKRVGFPAKTVKEIQTVVVTYLGKKITLKEIRAMLRYLLDNYNDVSYKKGVLTVKTEDIYSRGKNLGSFDIRLDLTNIGRGDDCHYYVLTLSPRERCGHIYSSSGRLCFGDGWNASLKSLKDGRIDDFVDIVQAILRT